MAREVTSPPDIVNEWRPLGQVLVERGLISVLQLHAALRQHEREDRRLGEVLLARGWISATDLLEALAEQQGLDSPFRPGPREGPAGELSQAIPLGRLLMRRGYISEAQLDAALAEQRSSGRKLGQILVGSGAVPAVLLAGALAEQQGLALSQASWEAAQGAAEDSEPRYEVRETSDGKTIRLFVTPSFLDATDLAFAILREWEPDELQVVCIEDDRPEQIWWRHRRGARSSAGR